MPKLKVAVVSLESAPDSKSSNLARIEAWARKAAGEGADLICFPAMAVTSYWQTSEACHQAEILKPDLTNPALPHPIGPSVKRLEALAKEVGAYLAAGIIEDFDYYHLRNSVGVFSPAGLLGAAAQMHTPVEPHPTFVPGRDCRIFGLDGVNLGVMVGDDVFFPEVSRMLAVRGAGLLVAFMATPADGRPDGVTVWREQMRAILAARAMENGAAVIAVEPAGLARNATEETAYHFLGQAMAVDLNGRLIAQTDAGNAEKMLLVELDVPIIRGAQLSRRRPELYQPLIVEAEPENTPGMRASDWDAQGELIWSRLRDLGFFDLDLYNRPVTHWRRQHQAVVVTIPSLPPLDGYQAVILTRPCLAHLTPDECRHLSRWVTAGGTLILDGYCGRNSNIMPALTGIHGPLRREIHLPSYRDASRVTVRVHPSAPDPVFAGMGAGHGSKVWGQVWLPEREGELNAQPLAELISPAGERLGPVVFQHSAGQGRVYTFTYSLGYSQLLLMQGRGSTRDLGGFPERVAPDAPKDGDVNMWGDQVVTDAEDQFFPSADYHLIPVLNMLRVAVQEHVLVSPVPHGKKFGVIFTGDSDRARANLVNLYTEILARYGIRPTQFILRGGYKARELNADIEYGVHPLFHETERECFDILVSYGFHPGQLRSGRRHCLIQYGLTESLERMAECGIRYTSNNWDFPYPETRSAAFLFGTALPHHIYNWEGKRIGIVDVPQVFMDYAPVLECTQASYRDVRRSQGVGAWNFHPQNLVVPGVREAIEWLAASVRRDDAWCGTMGEYGEWYCQRDGLAVICDEQGARVVGEIPPGLSLLSPRKELLINGRISNADDSSVWYGRKYWVHAIQQEAEVGDLHSSLQEVNRACPSELSS